MRTEIVLTVHRIEEMEIARRPVASPAMGAVISFLGLVRGREENGEISAIDYEAFEQMARHQFDRIFATVGSRWPVESIRLVHRIGPVLVGEASIWVEVVTPHRAEAFAACQFIIDEMKRVVPIWKRPVQAD